jgi:hypothetical protein
MVILPSSHRLGKQARITRITRIKGTDCTERKPTDLVTVAADAAMAAARLWAQRRLQPIA